MYLALFVINKNLYVTGERKRKVYLSVDEKS